MKAQDIEIPLVRERNFRYRLFEILPGAITWTVLFLPFILSALNPRLAVAFIIAYLLLWFVKSIGLNVRALQGYNTMSKHKKYSWSQMLKDLSTGEVTAGPRRSIPKWHGPNVRRLKVMQNIKRPNDIIHAIIVATYKESREVLEPTINSIIDSNYDTSKVILVLAYEERGGVGVAVQAQKLIADYAPKFGHAFAVKHPSDFADEVIGKGGNITYAGRELQKYVKNQNIDPANVIVTTLDSDNRPDSNYLAALTYTYVLSVDSKHTSYQPIPMFTNNIWDVPAPMRVIATGNSFWNVVLSLRPHMLRNFSSHAQGLDALIDTNFWSVRTIVEDGHQFWRTYFRYNGRHEVYPIYVPIYQDAVFSSSYFKTLRAQFIQLRRWAWGASDIAYVADKGFFTSNKIPKLDLMFKFLRLLEGHVTWAVAPLIIAFFAFIPPLLNPKDYASVQLPIIASRIATFALIGICATLFISIKSLPPKPARYKHHRSLFMLLQWVYLPVTTILYNSFSALYSQTRLMFGWYIDKFDFTEKTVMTEDKRKIT